MRGRGLFAAAAAAFAVLAAAPAALADDLWFPASTDATWTYQWTDSVYSPTPTAEKITVKSVKGATHVLSWTTDGLSNPTDAITSNGTMTFEDTDQGINAVDWQSTSPPSTFPVLCASSSGCGNSVAGTLYLVAWGSRYPLLKEPLVAGATWTSTGGFQNDVTSNSTYLGVRKISVPAFPQPVEAAGVETQITQAGAQGDPYGSGTRTVWWVYGVGPVMITFRHTGGGNDATTSTLQSTNLKPLPAPSDVDYVPFKKGLTLTYSWTNNKHLTKPEVEKFTIDQVVNNTARYSVQNVSGPIKVKGSYGFSKSVSGVTNLWGSTASATLLKFPPLGPNGVPVSKRVHFVTPFDLMSFGFNPILDEYPSTGARWSSNPASAEFATFGVTGSSTVVGLQKVTVPAGSFDAIVVRSTLKQPGYPYGSGTRTCWFAPEKGLVKLVFDHGDGSVSTAVLVK
jgi:hypothetical protein